MGHNGESGSGGFDEIPSWYAEEAAAAAAAPPTEHLQRTGGPRPPASMSMANGGSTGGGLGLGGMFKIGAVGVVLVGAFLGTRGTTAADALEVGDCFIMTDELEIDRLETPDCDETHDSEVVGLVTVPGPNEYPSQFDPYWDEVFLECEGAAIGAMANADSLPSDTQLEMFTPLEFGWNRGDRESICVIHAPSGLTGSVVSSSGVVAS